MGAGREEVDGGGGVEEVVGVLKYTIRKVKNYCIHINIMYVYHFFLGGGSYRSRSSNEKLSAIRIRLGCRKGYGVNAGEGF